MVRCHGSQCGFCTPGFVIALHGMLEAGMEFTDSGLRYALSGNLCRCTGYVSILQAGQAIDPCKLPRLKRLYPEQVMLEEFNALESDSIRLSTRDGLVFIPRTLEHAIELRAEHPQATVVSGATDYGVSRNHRKVLAGQTLCLSNVRGFSGVSIHDHILSIGGGATWCAIEQFVKHRVPEYHAILQRFGSPQIRNVGTLAGNLANGSPIADSLPFHFVSQAVIELRSVRGTRRVSIEDFYQGYRQSVLAKDELITAVETPLPRANERIKLYKISKRRDMDISSVTFGLWLKLEGDVIQEVRLALGGVGPTVQRLFEVESSLVGRNIDEESFRQAGRVARRAISPWTDVRGSAEYRSQLVENLMLKSFYDLRSPDQQ
jgi:xanthine dehydrogenase small subunit